MTNKKNNKELEKIEIVKKELDFVTCPRHGVRYPKGSSCPNCLAESKRK